MTEDELKDIPEELLKIPGILQKVIDFYMVTAIKPQKQFAVLTALMVGSNVMGRRFVTDQENWSTLYVIAVGGSSCGKEDTNKVQQKIFHAAGLENYIGGGGYTSTGAVISALLFKPCHMAVIDEVGRLIKSTEKDSNSNKIDAQTTLMTLFGCQNGIYRPQQYSLLKYAVDKRSQLNSLFVVHPALSVLGMTTPTTLYESVNSSYIIDGFLSRFIIVQTSIDDMKSQRIKPISPDRDLINWMKDCAKTNIPKPGENLVVLIEAAESAPNPKVIPFTEAAYLLTEKYEDTITELKKEYGKKLAPIFGKSREIAMKVSLIIAMSCQSDKIKPEHFEWAEKFVTYYTKQTADNLFIHVSDSTFEGACKQVFDERAH